MINLKVVLCHQSWRKIAASKVEMRNSDPTMQCFLDFQSVETSLQAPGHAFSRGQNFELASSKLREY